MRLFKRKQQSERSDGRRHVAPATRDEIVGQKATAIKRFAARAPHLLSATARRRMIGAAGTAAKEENMRIRPLIGLGGIVVACVCRQAGGHWFEPSTAHLRKPRKRGALSIRRRSLGTPDGDRGKIGNPRTRFRTKQE